MGVAMCAAAAPGHFAVVNGRSTPLANPTAVTDEFWDAVTSCPVSALEVRDARSGDLLDAD
jgi:ferredoxin